MCSVPTLSFTGFLVGSSPASMDHRAYFDSPSALSPKTTGLIQSPSTVHPLDDSDEREVDEPPDEKLIFSRMPMQSSMDASHYSQDRHPSLLTQALTSPNLNFLGTRGNPASTLSAGSATSVAELTSDGNLTTPPRSATPSPPIPPTGPFRLPFVGAKESTGLGSRISPNVATSPKSSAHQAPGSASTEQPRKRCITFACPRLEERPENVQRPPQANAPLAPKRPCALRFACPSKPSREVEPETPPSQRRMSVGDTQTDDSTPRGAQRSQSESAGFRVGREPTGQEACTPFGPVHQQMKKRPRTTNGARLDDDEWTKAQPTARQKLTVTDCLRKENVIRKLGEEAEEEALEEELEVEDDDSDGDEDVEADDDDDADEEAEDEEAEELESDELLSDGGNESDNEAGFAESDDESDVNSAYQFWTPGAAVSNYGDSHPEVILPRRRRAATDSSTEGVTEAMPIPTGALQASRRRRAAEPMRPRTPELPDSTDFVCGTLDEDRPLEAAYMSCMEQRRLAKHKAIPQDVDPSFPTDESENESDEDNAPSHERCRGSDVQASALPPSDLESGRSRARLRSPAPSPRRLRSPAPKRTKSPAPTSCRRRAAAHGGPPAPLLFSRSPSHTRSPLASHLSSPPSSPRKRGAGVAVPRLAQRPRPTHATSLPRTPNPFWREHARRRRCAGRAPGGAAPGRGPIDIVQGLEARNRRRRERLHGRHHAAAQRERRGHHHHPPQPGKGAERMREVGLEMADRCRGYGQRIQLMLSI